MRARTRARTHTLMHPAARTRVHPHARTHTTHAAKSHYAATFMPPPVASPPPTTGGVGMRAAGVAFHIKPYIRFAGEVGEQATMFFPDPSGNFLEFKSFKDPSQLFAKDLKS